MWVFAPVIVWLWARHRFMERRYPKIIGVGVAVGAVVGVVIGEIKGDWWIVLYGAAVGLGAGAIVELIVGIREKKRFMERFRK